MKVKLYKPFEHWYHGGTIWLISDTHFDDPDSFAMNPNWLVSEEYVKVINSFVSKNDTLIHLGDVGNVEWVSKLKGYKVLLLGNHDKGVTNYMKKYSVVDRGKVICDNLLPDDSEEVLHEYLAEHVHGEVVKPIITNNGLFDEVYDGSLFINDKILLSHEPVDIPFGMNIHGHVHLGEQSIYKTSDWVKINVCSDVRNWKPVRLDKIIGEFKVTTLHRQTVDRASKKIKSK